MGLFTTPTSSYVRAQTDRAWQHTARTAERAAHTAQLAGQDARRAATTAASRLGTFAGTLGGAIAAAALSKDDDIPSGMTRQEITPGFVDEVVEDIEDRLDDGIPLRRALAGALTSYTPLLLEEPRESRSLLKTLGALAGVALVADLAARAATGRGLVALIASRSESPPVAPAYDADGTGVIGGPRPVPASASVDPRSVRPSDMPNDDDLLPVTQDDLGTAIDPETLAKENGDDATDDLIPPPELKRI